MDPNKRPGDGLDAGEIERYSRHLTLPEVGMEGQLRLRAASVLLVGAGGLGAPLAMYLAAAGVGRLGLVDFDRVDLSNLQRQILFETGDIDRPKVERARERIAGINPHVDVVAYETRLSADNARSLIEGYDVVIDGTDNFPTRYLINDACVLMDKPNVYGSIFRFEGQVSLFRASDGPCYRCLYPEAPAPGSVPSCAEGGVLGVLPGVIGSLQATEAIKWILGKGESLIGRLMLFDALEMRFRELRLRKDPDCPVCGEQPSIRDLSETRELCAPAPTAVVDRVGAGELRELLSGDHPPLLLDVRNPPEWEICRIEGAQLIPLPELDRRLGEIDGKREIVCYCHVGIRSLYAAKLLRENGFSAVSDLAGGIDAWSREVDDRVARY